MMDVKAEHINPYSHDDRSKTEQVRHMFDSIAPAYDFMNRMMTFGIDRMWRAKAIRLIAPSNPENILDVATGTGDLALMMATKLHPRSITGVDLSEGMLEIGACKVAAAKGIGATKISFEKADCLDLPFADNTFDCTTVAYGVRNFEHLLEGYKEMYRTLRPGGTLCVIELSTPTSPLVKPLYKIYTGCVIPTVGRMVSRDSRAYSYLPESIAAVPQGNDMLRLMEEAGFSDTRFVPLTFGVCTIYLGKKTVNLC